MKTCWISGSRESSSRYTYPQNRILRGLVFSIDKIKTSDEKSHETVHLFAQRNVLCTNSMQQKYYTRLCLLCALWVSIVHKVYVCTLV